MDRERYAKREWYCEKAGDKTGKNPDGQWREISGNIRHGECGDVDLAKIHACRDWSRNSSSDHQPTVNAVERVHDKFKLDFRDGTNGHRSSFPSRDSRPIVRLKV